MCICIYIYIYIYIYTYEVHRGVGLYTRYMAVSIHWAVHVLSGLIPRYLLFGFVLGP